MQTLQFKCSRCNKWFIQNLGFEAMRVTLQAITLSLNPYFNGESSRHVSDSTHLIRVDATHTTIQDWIRRYVGLMKRYLESITSLRKMANCILESSVTKDTTYAMMILYSKTCIRQKMYQRRKTNVRRDCQSGKKQVH